MCQCSGYSIPDSTQPGTSDAYEGLGRLTSSTDPLSNTTTNQITVVRSAPGTGDSACYEQTLTIDPLGHQGGGLVDALGRTEYVQRYTGNSPATYAVYATAKYTYDAAGQLTTILHPDGSSSTTFSYDGAGRKSGMGDPDSGAWSYRYDPDGNLTRSIDPRRPSATVYADYDGIDRSRPVDRRPPRPPTTTPARPGSR